MPEAKKIYVAIDLKSFYASVECVERGLDSMDTNLVVADSSRTEKTICLAVSPSLKAYGIPGRPRLFEVVQKIREVNARRRCLAPGQKFTASAKARWQLLQRSTAVRFAGAFRGLHHSAAADVAVSGIQYENIRYLPEACGAGGHPCVFHR